MILYQYMMLSHYLHSSSCAFNETNILRESQPKKFTWINEVQIDCNLKQSRYSFKSSESIVFQDNIKLFHLYVEATDVAIYGCFSFRMSIRFSTFLELSLVRRKLILPQNANFYALIYLNSVGYFRYIIFEYYTTVYSDHQGVIFLFSNVTRQTFAMLDIWILKVNST